MKSLSLNIRVADTRGALARVITVVYDRGADAQQFSHIRDETKPEGWLTLTTEGGGPSLHLQLDNVVAGIQIETKHSERV